MHEVAISVDGVPIHYEVHGQGAPALVFVHGWCCNRSHWHKQVERFAHHYTVVAIDLAGHGESGLNRDTWTMPAFGQDVVAVVEQQGLAQVALIGHSMGGTVIVEAARRMPARVIGLVGVDTFRNLEQTWTNEAIDAFVTSLRINFREACGEFARTSMFVPTSQAAFVEAIVEEMAATPPQVGIGAVEESMRHDTEVRAGLQAIQAPISAINTAYYPTDIEAARRYGVEVVLMPGVGHFVMMEDPETFNHLLEATIKRFLAAVPKERHP